MNAMKVTIWAVCSFAWMALSIAILIAPHGASSFLPR